MKVSVSLPVEDVEFLDDYAREQGGASRSSALQDAVRLLRMTRLGDAYAQAWEEWDGTDDARLWERTVGDGVES